MWWMMWVMSASGQEAYPTGHRSCVSKDGEVEYRTWSKQGGNAPGPADVVGTEQLIIRRPGETVSFAGQRLNSGKEQQMPVTVEVLSESAQRGPNPGPYGEVSWTQKVRIRRAAGGDLLVGEESLKLEWTCKISLAPPIPMAPPGPSAPRMPQPIR